MPGFDRHPFGPMQRLLAALILVALAAAPAHADLQDEIQVYDDAINEPGEFGVELHVNTTPSGRSTPDYPGEVTPDHGWRVTPELSWGLTKTLGAGLYLPLARDTDGHWDLAGLKLRLKFLPWQTEDGRGGFGGVNVEVGRLKEQYSQQRNAAEMRFIAGWRSADWLLVANPILGFALSGPGSGQRPEFELGLKATRRFLEGFSAGAEYYSATGPIGDPLPWQQQDNRLFAVLDVDRKPWIFNVGIGRGLTDAADRWTVKAIFDLPF